MHVIPMYRYCKCKFTVGPKLPLHFTDGHALYYYRWYKPIFFHTIDVAVVNSYILFQQWRQSHPEIEELQRAPGKYNTKFVMGQIGLEVWFIYSCQHTTCLPKAQFQLMQNVANFPS